MRQSKLIIAISTVMIAVLPAMAFAQSAEGTASLGDIATNLLAPTEIVTKLVDVACYVIGIAFLLVGLAQYKIHRQSPKLVPLTTPITLAILGMIALLIPYVTTLTKTGKSEHEKKAAEENQLPVPDLNRNKNLPLPLPSPKKDLNPPPSTPENTPQPDSGAGSGGSTEDSGYRHWSQ